MKYNYWLYFFEKCMVFLMPVFICIKGFVCSYPAEALKSQRDLGCGRGLCGGVTSLVWR